MKTNSMSSKWIFNAIKLYIGIVASFAFYSCDSDNSDIVPQNPLTNIDWQEAKGCISLNGEILHNATAEFHENSDSNDITLVLHGVHPCDDIDVSVKTVNNDEGNIRFNGTQLIDNVGIIKVDGLFNCSLDDKGAVVEPSVSIDITYMLPNISYISMTIPFDESSGFSYVRDPGVYPMATVDNEAIQDSCEMICQNINSELSKSLKSISFDFDSQGKMRLSYITRNLYEYSQVFRYWLKIEKSSCKKIIEVENADQFYQKVFNAMNLDITDDMKEFMQSLPYNIARFNIERQDSELSGMVVFLDEIQYEIFPYFNRQFSENGIWDNNKKDYLDLIYAITKDMCKGSPEHILNASSYRWALKKYD